MNIYDTVLKGKVAIITGSGRGIGKAIAIAYAKSGADVVCAARSEAETEQTVNEISAKGGKAIAVKTDVTSIESVNSMFERASRILEVSISWLSMQVQTMIGKQLKTVNLKTGRER